MVEYGIYIGREDRFIGIVDRYGRIGPPEEGLRKRCPVINFCFYLNIGFVGIKRDAMHPLQSEHPFHLIAPDRFASIRIRFNHKFGRIKGAGPVMLRPVKLDPSRYPGSG
ncbi:hypothetical protein SDC9_206608 [bioreactor metagenome]|uniref:Uncharacterized protein n=1 Tax=bioreactor metagenome TaxID=1076179 RepID=A0A645J6Y6_9ZZZZ